MGYDHMDPDEQKEMRAMEEKALGMAGIARGEGPASVTDAELLALARLAMENSYSPYRNTSCGKAARTTNRSFPNASASVRNWTGTVSYTHLDVYKRQ